MLKTENQKIYMAILSNLRTGLLFVFILWKKRHNFEGILFSRISHSLVKVNNEDDILVSMLPTASKYLPISLKGQTAKQQSFYANLLVFWFFGSFLCNKICGNLLIKIFKMFLKFQELFKLKPCG